MSDKPIKVYLASPYSHDDPNVRRMRFLCACQAADDLMAEGLVVFSPIAHSVAIENSRPDGRIEDGSKWLVQDFPWLDVCDAIVVLTIDGWRQSKGVTAETDRWQQQRRGPCISWNQTNYTPKEIAGLIREQLREHWDRKDERESILTEADRLTSTDRRATYGHPSDNFGRIAQMLNAYLGDKVSTPLDATDVGMMQALTKIARHGHSRKRDNLTDLCGYARCVSVCEGYEE
jgi:hypothetical protein